MAAYFARRLLLMIPTFIGITFLVFTITRFVPGGPVEQMILQLQMAGSEEGGSGGGNDLAGGTEITEEQRLKLESYFHFDWPIWKQYLQFIGPFNLDERGMFGQAAGPTRVLDWRIEAGQQVDVDRPLGRLAIAGISSSDEVEPVEAQLEVLAPGTGTLTEVHVATGDEIAPGDRLATLTLADGTEQVLVAPDFWSDNWSGILTGDLGESYKFNRPVMEVIQARFPVSIYFGLIGFLLAYSVCVPLGVAKAVKHGSSFDFVSSALVFVGYSIPGWALGGLLLVLLGGGSFWDVFPLGGFRSPEWDQMSVIDKALDQVNHTVLPVIAYAVGSFASLTVLMKNSLMENLGQDYVRTAFAKGLGERRVILVHALRNSLIPICTGLGHAIGLVMAGSYLIEKVFNIDGIGYLGFTAIVERDYAVVMGILVINTALILLGNILSDVLYVLVDPRIRFS
jgi:microcin C transport system permease protein